MKRIDDISSLLIENLSDDLKYKLVVIAERKKIELNTLVNSFLSKGVSTFYDFLTSFNAEC